MPFPGESGSPWYGRRSPTDTAGQTGPAPIGMRSCACLLLGAPAPCLRLLHNRGISGATRPRPERRISATFMEYSGI